MSTSSKEVSVGASPTRIKQEKLSALDRHLWIVLRVVSKIVLITFTFISGVVVGAIVLALIAAGLYLRQIATYANTSSQQILETVLRSATTPIPNTNGRENLLILGTDAIANRDSYYVLTDTMMVASVGLEKGDVKLISLPRDLWIASQSGKINSIYRNGKELVPAVIGDITGIAIHRIVVVDIATVATIIDAMNGIDIDVERSFIDYEFPRMDVDVRTETDPKKLYETVAFTKGREHMNGDRILHYIRSRHSSDEIEGSDDGRVRRQHQVIAALLSKLKDPTLVRSPEILGRLLGLYQKEFEKDLPLRELLAVGIHFMKAQRSPTIASYQLPVRDLRPDGVIYHPEVFSTPAWVYLPVDPSWNQIRTLVSSWIAE